MTLKKHLLGLLFVLLGTGLWAQDIHFSQFYMSPLNLNPALTGVMNCNTRLIGNYRNQWAGVLGGNAYNTYSVSYDQKVAVGRTDYFGIGGSLWSDVAGQLSFGTTQGRLSFAYSKKMGGYRDKSHYLSIGADAAVSQRRIRQSAEQIWPSQHNGDGEKDPNIAAPGVIGDYDFIYADLAVGLLWFSILDKNNNIYAGLALHHINQPDVTFTTDGSTIDPLSSRLTFHGGGQFYMKRGMYVVPNLVFLRQGEHVELNLGTSLRFAIGNQRVVTQSWEVGLWYRHGRGYVATLDSNNAVVESAAPFTHSDALIFATRFDYEQFGIGFSYDYNISKLRQGAAGNGSFEFSINYYICGPEKRAVYCPRF